MYAWTFLYGDLVFEPCDKVDYGSYKEFVGVVALGRWLLDKIVYEVYTIEVVFKYVYILRVFCVFLRPNRMAYNFAHSIFWKHGSFYASCMFFIRLYTPKSATLLLFFPAKKMKELLVYMFCNGLYLGGFVYGNQVVGEEVLSCGWGCGCGRGILCVGNSTIYLKVWLSMVLQWRWDYGLVLLGCMPFE